MRGFSQTLHNCKIYGRLMKLLIWNLLSKLNSKGYHVVKEKIIIYDAILKLLFLLFLTLFRVNKTRVGEDDRKRHVKIWKVEFRFFSPQYSNSRKEYLSGKELSVETFLRTVSIQTNSWINFNKMVQKWSYFFPSIIYKSHALTF